MSGRRIKLLNWIVIKPLWLAYLVLALVYFFQSKWFIGVFLLVMNILFLNLSKWLYDIECAAEEDQPRSDNVNSDDLSYEEASVMSKLSMAIAYIIGLTAIILSIHHDIKFYVAITLGVIVAWIGPRVIGRGFLYLLIWVEFRDMDTG